LPVLMFSTRIRPSDDPTRILFRYVCGCAMHVGWNDDEDEDEGEDWCMSTRVGNP